MHVDAARKRSHTDRLLLLNSGVLRGQQPREDDEREPVWSQGVAGFGSTCRMYAEMSLICAGV
jgi:hypothetical protein